MLESKLDRGRGPVATILVQDGTLRVGDTFIAGPIVGRVRALIDDRGKPIKSAPPSTPVEVLGLTGLPQPGDAFQAMTDAAKARQIATYRQGMAKEKALGAKGSRLTLESLQQQIAEGGMKDLPIVIKSDVQGSAEVLADTLSKLERRPRAHQDHPLGRRRHQRIGRAARIGVERDHHRIQRASRSQRRGARRARRGGHPPPHRHLQRDRRDEEGDDGLARADAQGSAARAPPKSATSSRFPRPGPSRAAMCVDGRITRSGDSKARLMRDGAMVHEGKISSLRRFKDDVSEVKTGFECGIAFDKFNDIKVGDVIEVFTVERIAVSRRNERPRTQSRPVVSRFAQVSPDSVRQLLWARAQDQTASPTRFAPK